MSETQANLLNFVANKPEVRQGIAPGFAQIDLSRYLDMPGTLLFGDEHGLIMFVRRLDFQYEGHYLLTDTADRRHMMQLARRAIAQLFTKEAASAIRATTPRGFLGARTMNRALGLVPCGKTTDTSGRDCIKYILERETWQASLHRQ